MTIIEQFVKPKTEKGKKKTIFFLFIFRSGLVRNSFRNDLKRNTRILCIGHCAPYNTVDNSNFFRNHSRIKNVCFMGTSKKIHTNRFYICLYMRIFQFVVVTSIVTLFTLSIRSSMCIQIIYFYGTSTT